MNNNLKGRIEQFKKLSLPGGYMGTAYLVEDLWHEILRLRTAMSDKDKVLMPKELTVEIRTAMSDKDKVLMPKELTAENGAKALLVGDFFETRIVPCPKCDDNYPNFCTYCNAIGRVPERVIISWTNIKAIYKKVVEELGEKDEH